ncbi:hypothetical protein [Streptomyces cyaneofuscatus]|uniref:hypothetical protein n=1 Tax=Streptomyces cyaneofuscatus TaxID=66883 RepID=UPI003665F0A4
MLAQRQVLLVPGGGHVVEEFGRGALGVARVAGEQLVGGEGDVDGRGGQVFGGEGVAAVDVQDQEVANLVAGLDGDGVLARRVRVRDGEAGVVEGRRGDGLGEHRLGQQVVVGGLRVLEGQRVVDAGLGGEPHRVAARVGVRGREVRAAAQRVGDPDRVVVGVEQRALVAVDGRKFSGHVFAPRQ